MADRQWNPGELLEVSGYFWKTCTLHAAVKLDVFTHLGQERLSSEALADKLQAAPDAVERLLNALVAMELLAKKENRFFHFYFNLIIQMFIY